MMTLFRSCKTLNEAIMKPVHHMTLFFFRVQSAYDSVDRTFYYFRDSKSVDRRIITLLKNGNRWLC